MTRHERKGAERAYETPPGNWEYQQLYDQLLQWFQDRGSAGMPNRDALPGDDAREYTTPVAGEDNEWLFQVPTELLAKNPRAFNLTLRTAHRFDASDMPRQLIIVSYHYGDYTDLSAAYIVDGAIAPGGFVSWTGDYMVEGDGITIEDVVESIDRQHFDTLQSIVTQVTRLKS